MALTTTSAGHRHVTYPGAPPAIVAHTTTRDVAGDAEHPSFPANDYLEALGTTRDRVAWCAQVHGARILASTVGGRQGEADALITNRPGLVLSIRTADCVPVFLADPVRGAIGLVHAGWRGAALGIAAEAVRALTALYGSRPGDLWAALGPSIGGAHYEVGPEVAERFDDAHLERHGERWHLDVAAAVGASLRAAGVENVQSSGLCTVARNDAFHSYRREGHTGRLYSLLWLGVAPERG